MVDRRIVIGGAIAGAGLVGILIYRHAKNLQQQSAAAQTASAQAASGYGYGMSAQYGYGGYGNGYYGYGEPGNYYGYGASGGFYPQGYYGYGVTSPPGVTPNTTNGQWAQAAISQLQSEGYDPQAVSGALGAYELGQPVDAAQVNIVQAAIGIEGYPPVPGPNGYPPAIMHQGTGGGGGGGGQGGKTVKVPNVVGMSKENAHAALSAVGLKYTDSGGNGAVYRQSRKAGSTADKGITVKLTERAR